MFLVILIAVSVLLSLANWQMTSAFLTYMESHSMHSSMHQPQEQLLSSIHDSLAWVGALILLVGLAASYLLARRVTDPLRKLSAAAEQVGAGQYDTPILEENSDEVGQLADSLRAMTKSLKENQVMRQRLFADIAHELKTPLTVIQGNLEGMIEEVVSCDKAQLSSLLEETIHLKRLISDLRDLSLAEAGQLRIEQQATDVNQLAAHVTSLLQPLAEEKKIQLLLDTAELPEVFVDPARITQVLYNLLTNAIRYTQYEGKISVSTKIMQRDGQEWVSVCVEDNGPGIPAEDLPFVFDHFYRVDPSRDRRSGGTGIGLAIVKQLVEIHGGQVTVESKVGAGCLFCIYLPV